MLQREVYMTDMHTIYIYDLILKILGGGNVHDISASSFIDEFENFSAIYLMILN